MAAVTHAESCVAEFVWKFTALKVLLKIQSNLFANNLRLSKPNPERDIAAVFAAAPNTNEFVRFVIPRAIISDQRYSMIS